MGKKRYSSATQIHQDIDRAKEKFNRLLDQALIQDNLGRVEEAVKLRVKARRIKDNQLDILKGKLAELNTMLLPGVITDGDPSIPASSRKPKPKAHQ